MSDFLELLEWLSTDQAHALITRKTGKQPTYDVLFGLADSGHFNVYIKTDDLKTCCELTEEKLFPIASGMAPILRGAIFDLNDYHGPFMSNVTAICPARTLNDILFDEPPQEASFSTKRDTWVVPYFKTSEIKHFIEKLTTTTEAPPAEKPLEPRERASVAKIINVLAAAAGIDLSQPHKAEATFSAQAASLGLEAPSPATIVKFFKLANEQTKENQP